MINSIFNTIFSFPGQNARECFRYFTLNITLASPAWSLLMKNGKDLKVTAATSIPWKPNQRLIWGINVKVTNTVRIINWEK